ncbi:MAG TPA: hypothetical protein DEQ47_00680, partial [Solibacterales bacterium]|nr:hypothetical protein [Bryobacterales bacterium]
MLNNLSVLKRIKTGMLLLPVAVGVTFAQTPAISPGGTVNGASFASGPVAAGSLVSIFGTQFAAALAAAESVPLSVSLAGTSVTFNNVPAPLDFVSPGQINAQVPFNVLPDGGSGSINVVVTRNGVSSAPDQVVINQFGPGVFAANTHAIAIIATNPSDPRYATLAAPPGSIPGLTTNPAVPGDVLIIYATGLGPVNPPVQSG